MESTTFYPPQSRFPFSYASVSPSMYPSALPHTPQSFIRSSAGQHFSPPSPQTYYHQAGYSQPPPLSDMAEDSPSSSSSSSNNSGNFMPAHNGDVQIQEHPQEYIPEYSYHLAASHAANGYPSDDAAIPRQHMWSPEQVKQEGYPSYSPPHPFDAHPTGARFDGFGVYYQQREDPPYAQQEQLPHPHEQLALAGYYEAHDQQLATDAPLAAYTTQGAFQPDLMPAVADCSPTGELPPSVVSGFSNSPRLSGQDIPQEQVPSPPPPYMSSPSSSSLQYPPSPVEVASAPPQAFVSMQDVSPSPTVSPDQVCTSLPLSSPTGYGFPGNSPFTSNSGSSYEYAEDASPGVISSAMQRRPESIDRPLPKKHRYASSEDDDSPSGSGGDSGESEREDDGDDADDDEYRPDDARSTSRGGSRRRTSARQASARSYSPVDLQKPRLAPPVPVPNLTKKSRGRRVPTTAVVVSQNGVEKVCPPWCASCDLSLIGERIVACRTSADTNARSPGAISASSEAST